MSRIIRPITRWTRQPSNPVALDPASSLTRGLVFAWSGVEGNYDPVSRRTATRDSSVVVNSGAFGRGMAFSATPSLSWGATWDFLAGARYVSAQVLLKAPASISGGDKIFGKWGGGTNLYLMEWADSSNIAGLIGNESGNRTGKATSSAGMAANGLYNIIWTWDGPAASGGTHSMWVNGVYQSLSDYANSDPINVVQVGTSTSTSSHQVGCSDDNGGNSTIFAVRLWSRLLDEREVGALNANPWRILVPMRRPVFASVSGGSVSSADGSAAITFGVTGVGASRASGSGSTTVVLSASGAGAARSAAAGNTGIVFGVTGVGQGVTAAHGSTGITFDMTGVGASRASGAGSTSIVFSQTGVGAARQGAAGSTSITLDALGAGASSVVAAGSTAIVFDVQGVGAAAAAGTASGRADIVFDAQGVGASRVSGAGSAGLVFDAPGEGASRVSAVGLQQIVFDVQGVGFESAPTIVSADGSASIVLGMFGDTTQAAADSEGGKVRGRVRRVQVAYDEEADLMEIMAAALPMLRARGMLWDR